jgi:hypothetical protein
MPLSWRQAILGTLFGTPNNERMARIRVGYAAV